MNRRWYAVSAMASAAVLAALVACADGDNVAGSPAPEDEAPFNEGTNYAGPSQGGLIPEPDAALPEFMPTSPAVIPPPCCLLTLTLPDATENETTRLLRGTYAPLNAPNGIPLTYASGAWQATVCLEVNASYTYWFDFTERDDAGSPTFEEDLRYNPALPNEGNGRGGRLNVVAPIPSCASIDASVGPSAH